MTWQTDRRGFLTIAGLAAGAAAGSPLLTGCGKSKSTDTAAANKKVTVPAYIPWQHADADLPAAGGVTAGYFGFPTDPVVGVTHKPGSGGSVTAMVNLFGSVPPGLSSNAYWQSLNDQLGVNLKLNMVPDSAYQSKMATTLAGGQLPDIVQIRTDQPQRASVLKALFANLTEYLSGDAIKDYPFLANLPAYAWPDMIYNGGIYALPTPRAPVGSILFARTDLIRAAGHNPAPASFAEFAELCKAVTNPRKNQWALGAGPTMVSHVMQMTGAPNGWRYQDGKFTYSYETDEARRALAATTGLVKAGVFHPDTFAGTADLRQWLGSGRIALNRDGYAAWDLLATTYPVDFGAQAPPQYDGGGDARVYRGATTFAFTALKKSSNKDRIKELLRICNWLAAPVGTKEYLFRKYGTEGVDYTSQSGVPTLTPKGGSQVALPLNYLIDSPPILGPGPKTRVQAQYDYQKRVVPTLLEDASLGLYAPTDSSKGAVLRKGLLDTMTEVLQSRKSLADWDSAIASWRSNGGDTIRTEYQQQYAASH